MGTEYVPVGRRYDQIVDIQDGEAVPPGARLLTRVEVGGAERRIFTVSLRAGEP